MKVANNVNEYIRQIRYHSHQFANGNVFFLDEIKKARIITNRILTRVKVWIIHC